MEGCEMTWISDFISKIKCALLNMCEVTFPVRILDIQDICQFYNNLTAINETIIRTLYWKLSVSKLISVGIKDQFLKIFSYLMQNILSAHLCRQIQTTEGNNWCHIIK